MQSLVSALQVDQPPSSLGRIALLTDSEGDGLGHGDWLRGGCRVLWDGHWTGKRKDWIFF